MQRLRHKILADSLLLIHIGWVAILIGGTLFIVGNRWYIPYHLSIISGTLLLNLILGGCPLTWWEERYRKAWNPMTESFENSFVAAYLKKLFGINMTSKQANWALFGLKAVSYYISINLLING